MQAGNVARVLFVVAACVAAAGSGTSGSNNAGMQQQYGFSPPPPSQMDASRALGLWSSTFGFVKIEGDDSRGSVPAGALHGVWQYQRDGRDVIGYFYGSLRGNVLQFSWNEPARDAASPPLAGEGYIVFDPSGRQYSGRWWTPNRDHVGAWNGWRQPTQGAQPAYPQYPSPYGGQTYGQYPQQPAYPQYPQQPAYPPQQPQYPQPQQPGYPRGY